MRIAFYSILAALSLLIALRPGWHSYHLNAHLSIISKGSGERCFAIVRLESQSPEEWEWTVRSPKYQEITIEVDPLDSPKIQGHVAQSHGSLRSGDRKIPCTTETLPEALAALYPALKRDGPAARFISEFVHNAQSAQLQPPRHHPHHLKEPIPASYTNFRSGGWPDPALGISLAAAVLICIGLEACVAITRRRARRAAADAAFVPERNHPCP